MAHYDSGNEYTKSDIPWIVISLCVVGAFILYNGIEKFLKVLGMLDSLTTTQSGSHS